MQPRSKDLSRRRRGGGGDDDPDDVRASKSRLTLRERPQRGPPFLVLANVAGGDFDTPTPGLFIPEEDAALHLLSPPLCPEIEDFRALNVVFKFEGLYEEDELLLDYVASCGDLMCFYNPYKLYVYSPSTAQYLGLLCNTRMEDREMRIGIVYIASMKLYKIVMLEVHPGSRDCPITPARQWVKFQAFTVEEEDEDGWKHDEHSCDIDCDEHQKAPWKYISEHDLPSLFCGKLGNLIGVNGVVYCIITLLKTPTTRHPKLLSLDLEERNTRRRFKILSLPACSGESNLKTCHRFCGTSLLSQVKDHLCYPHATKSSIELWMLEHPNTDWFKGYTISYAPTSFGYVRQLAYLPCPTTKTMCRRDSSAADGAKGEDDGAGAAPGLFLFVVGSRLFQYDMCTKKTECLWTYIYANERINVVSDGSFSLKNGGLRCTRVPPLNTHSPELERKITPPPQGSLPPPSSHSPPPPPQGSLPPPQPPYYSHPPPPQGSLPPPQPPYSSHHPLPQGSSLPPPSYFHPPPPQGCLPPPWYPCHPPPEGSVPPPYYYPELPIVSIPGLPAFNPYPFQYRI